MASQQVTGETSGIYLISISKYVHEHTPVIVTFTSMFHVRTQTRALHNLLLFHMKHKRPAT